MHKFSLLFLLLCFFVISCSEEETTPINDKKVTVSFGAVLNDLLLDKAANKQAIENLPACTDDEPSYVEIILLQGDTEVVGVSGNPFQIDLVSGQIYTEEVPELELDPDIYILDHFAVYNSSGELIWLAPRGGVLAEFIDNPLPLTIDLRAGVKKYVDVPVLCFDDRDVNQYGYLFFDLVPTEAVEFCFFANYCNDSGMHFPASYSVNVWLGTDNGGPILYSNVQNNVSTQGDDPSADPLCIALPILSEYADNEAYIYYEVTLLDWDGVYGDVNNNVYSGTLSREDILFNLDGEDAVDYEHIRFGCNVTNTNQFDAEVATSWINLFTELSRTTYFNPQSARLFAYSGLALYESVVPGMPSYQSVFSQISGETMNFEANRNNLYWPASANAALAQISKRLLQDYSQPLDLAAIEQLEADFEQEFFASVSEEKLQQSIAFGRQVADQIYGWSRTDGTFSPCPPYVPGSAPGTWVPTPPAPAAGFCQGDLRPFVANIAETAFPAPPPAYSTDPDSEFYQMNEMIYNISQNLTAEDHRIINAWRDIPGVKLNGPTHLPKLISDIIDQEDLNLADASVLLAKQGMAVNDAIIAAMYAKYEYTLVRPVTYIQDVLGHTAWNSVYPTPPHPSYPAIAVSPASAVVEILEDYFGENYAFEDATQHALYGVFAYETFDALIDDVKLSRTHSGLNYQLSVDVAEEVGRAVGDAVDDLNFRK